MKESKEIIEFVIALSEAIDKSLADKKIDLSDVPNFINPFLLAPNAFQDISKVKEELKNLDSSKVNELKEYISKELNLSSDKIEKVIEKSLKLVVDLYELKEVVKS